ncbi:hypothetical protein IHE31_02555 (plasmid) [Mycetohabitans rhizoxinica]|uniref:hypothetical protein n=1 Tax=Mycetohabitans rhizoxinica TaxID=412963 RepID=UPI0030D33776
MSIPPIRSVRIASPSDERNASLQRSPVTASAQHTHLILDGLQRRRSSAADGVDIPATRRDSLARQLDAHFDTDWHPLYHAPWTQAAMEPASAWDPLPVWQAEPASPLSSIGAQRRDALLLLPSARYLAAHGMPLSELGLELNASSHDDEPRLSAVLVYDDELRLPEVLAHDDEPQLSEMLVHDDEPRTSGVRADGGEPRPSDRLTHDDLRALVRSLTQHVERRRLRAMLRAAQRAAHAIAPPADLNDGATYRSTLREAIRQYMCPRSTRALRQAVCRYAPVFGEPALAGPVSDSTLKAMLGAAAVDGRLPMNLAELVLLPDGMTQPLRQRAKEAGGVIAPVPRQGDEAGAEDAGADDAQQAMSALEALQANGTISEDQYIAAANRLASLLGYRVGSYPRAV